MTVRLVTCRRLPEPDHDSPPLAAALRKAGVPVEIAAWDDSEVDWRGGLSVIRSPWDYHHRLDEFLAWLERASAVGTILNPPAVIRWNSHKRYLAELAEAGFSIVPTEHLSRGSRKPLAGVMESRGWSEVVVKPAVSAGSHRTLKVDAKTVADGERHLEELLADRDAMVQPFLRSVEGYGERAVVWISGAVMHAVRKSSRFAAQKESVSAAVGVADDERDLAERLIGWVTRRFSAELLYGRVDVARDEAGRPVLMELEVFEPSLFLEQHPPALERLVQAVIAKLRR